MNPDWSAALGVTVAFIIGGCVAARRVNDVPPAAVVVVIETMCDADADLANHYALLCLRDSCARGELPFLAQLLPPHWQELPWYGSVRNTITYCEEGGGHTTRTLPGWQKAAAAFRNDQAEVVVVV